MAETAAGRLNRGEEMLVWLTKQFNQEGDIVPRLNIDGGEFRELVFEAYDVDSVEALANLLFANSTTEQARAGILTSTDDESNFYTEAELLASVEGISDELAAGLVNECRDIPTICQRRRRTGKAFLGDLRHDMEVQGVDWLDELDALIDELDEYDNLESRLKDAGLWVEPDNEIAA